MSSNVTPEPRRAPAAQVKANLNPFFLTLSLSKITAQRVIARKLFWIMLILGLAPAIVAGFWMIVAIKPDISVAVRPYGLFRILLAEYYHRFFLPVLALALGLGAISEEIESRNITYTLVRPIPRIGIAAGRVLGHLFVGWLIIAFAITTVFFANLIFQVDELFSNLHHLLNIIFVMSFGFAGYLCVIAMVGTFWKKASVFISIAFLINDAFIASFSHPTMQYLSVRYRMMNSYWDALPRFNLSMHDITSGVASLNALVVLVLFVLIPLTVIAVRLSQFEIVLSGGTQE